MIGIYIQESEIRRSAYESCKSRYAKSDQQLRIEYDLLIDKVSVMTKRVELMRIDLDQCESAYRMVGRTIREAKGRR
jgi:hypothetical protein